jgi:NAD(P)-dependent dehydrogenase (short-subunit alcohol dehydrogenase family)
MKQRQLSGKVALITGAGSGIGRAIATLFAQQGARITIADIDEKAAEKTATQINRKGGNAAYTRADVSKSADTRKIVQTTLKTHGKLTTLVNNAGIESTGTVTELTEKNWDKVINTNLKGTFLCSKHSTPSIIEAGGGTIINIASVLGLIGSKREAAYCASKGGIISLTKAMALDLAPHNIRVNCICPGSVLTPTFKRVMTTTGNYKTSFAQNLEKIPLKRVAQPGEIAQAALYLASDESSYITGSTLIIDGGWSAH